jgi:thioredoxin 1
MPVFDTPITPDDRSLSRVLNQQLPVVVYLYDSRQSPNKSLEDALKNIAGQHVGEILIARVDIANNPDTHRQYGNPRPPALVTLGIPDHTVKSKAEVVSPDDVRTHVAYLLGKGPKPVQQTARPEMPQAGRSGAVHVTDATFQKAVLESKIPVFVDFWAPWCGPCLSIAPVIDRLAAEHAGRLKIVKLNVDENPQTQRRFQIQAIPTYITFRDGKPVGQRSGASQQIVREMIEQVLH